MSELLGDSRTMIGRNLRLTSRNTEALITSLALPIMLMLMFVYLFGGAIATGTSYVTYVTPSVILLCAAFGSATTAVGVTQDMTGGIIDRFRSMDVGGTDVLAGHVTASVARNMASSALVLGVGLLIGFRPHASPLAWLAAIGVLLAFVLALSWLSAVIGLLVKTVEGAGGFAFFMTFLPYASSGFVPIATMPTWIRGFARYQPSTPVIDTLRGLLLDRPLGSSPWLALAWCGGIAVLSAAAAGVLFRRRVG